MERINRVESKANWAEERLSILEEFSFLCRFSSMKAVMKSVDARTA